MENNRDSVSNLRDWQTGLDPDTGWADSPTVSSFTFQLEFDTTTNTRTPLPICSSATSGRGEKQQSKKKIQRKGLKENGNVMECYYRSE